LGKIISSYIFPHPPIIIPEIGKGEEKNAINTVDAVYKAAEAIKKDKPTTIVLTTPHGPVFQDYIYISTDNELSGSLKKFGNDNIKLNFKNNVALIEKIIKYSQTEGISAGGLDEKLIKKYSISKSLDHGAIVPLYFINKIFSDFKLVHISIAGLSFSELYKFGMCIRNAVNDMEEQVVFLASGDMSHKLSPSSPNGYSEKGKEFDELLIKSFNDLDIKALLNIDEGLCESAGECGLRSFIMMFGALDGYEVKPHVYSYEGPFGVGYPVAKFEVGSKDPERQVLKQVNEENELKLKNTRSTEDEYVNLARKALETYVTDKKILGAPKALPNEMLEEKAGAFVSIKKHGQLRGCIGTTGPTRKNIAEEIINNAISSGTRDPRFNSIEASELDSLVYSVDILKEPEPINTIEELDVIKYGVIVRHGARSGLLLPNLEGVDTPEQQVSISLQKAGIRPEEEYTMERFEVIRHL
jgi:MEMO1 family protein